MYMVLVEVIDEQGFIDFWFRFLAKAPANLH